MSEQKPAEAPAQAVKAKRFRGKGLSGQLKDALAYAKSLEQVETDETSISRMKLAQARIATLTTLVNRERSSKWRKLNDELKSAQSEIERLKQENQKLTAELATKPKTVVREMTNVERALAIIKAREQEEKSNGAI